MDRNEVPGSRDDLAETWRVAHMTQAHGLQYQSGFGKILVAFVLGMAETRSPFVRPSLQCWGQLAPWLAIG